MKPFLPDWAHPWIEAITIALQIVVIVLVAMLLRSLLHRFLSEAIEANGLAFGGGYNDDFSGFVVSGKAYGKVEEGHRALVQAWLAQQPALTDVKVGELRDAWYGWG